MKQVDLSRPDAELRLLEVFYHKIYKVLKDMDSDFSDSIISLSINPDFLELTNFIGTCCQLSR